MAPDNFAASRARSCLGIALFAKSGNTRENSPACGVRMTGCPDDLMAANSVWPSSAKDENTSASRTNGRRASLSNSRTNALSMGKAAESGTDQKCPEFRVREDRAKVVRLCDGADHDEPTCAAMEGNSVIRGKQRNRPCSRTLCSKCSQTRRTPWQAKPPVKMPAMPRAYLWVWEEWAGREATNRDFPRFQKGERQASGSTRGEIPMSATVMDPHRSRPGSRRCPGFLRKNVTVWSARKCNAVRLAGQTIDAAWQVYRNDRSGRLQ